MKKGFTLIELLAVIIILAIVAVIATPMVLNAVDDAKNSARDSKLKMYADNVKLKAEGNYFTNNGKIDGEIDVSTINNNSTTCAKAYYINGGVYLGNCTIDGVDGLYYVNGNIDNTSTNYDNALEGKILYKDNSGANIPELLDKMVAVKYDGTNWVVANLYKKWYDYDTKEWANAVVLNSGVSKNIGDTLNVDTDIKEMYVWIPRYKYTIFNDTADTTGVPVQEIQVTFEKNKEKTGTVSCTDNIGIQATSETCVDTNGTIVKGTSTYTHPAFTLNGKQLTGIWVGKFETSSSIMDSCTPTNYSIGTDCDVTTGTVQIKPNVTSWIAARLGTFYTAIQELAGRNNMANVDSHMMKNMEWGAIAYFAQSEYGRCTSGECTEISKNDSSNFLTGKSQGTATPTNSYNDNGTYNYDTTEGAMASTTNNIYGIYDMSGGALEYIMGNIATDINTPLVGADATYNSGFAGNYYGSNGTASGPSAVFTLDTTYTNLYSYDASNWNTYSRGKLGDATKETLLTYGNMMGGWYGDNAYFPWKDHPWFRRGGYYRGNTSTGLFFFDSNCGDASIISASRTVLVSKNN